ncbi:integrase arm-type DNA-binding domain-containing protein [Komagataeibacter nataicola]|uniref:tyrosine-type recombinase/integrase n=1 Tax=Komagataeibacter nataicola TaxID=265960 RepID=UPI0023DCFAD4|nr:integrase arm-type DNA-binding domain-containing protein [Komagataeibacter nataicola]WEQ55145.1 integrase arm-type DNA-binding domain-containing protein [Komagataeibacter nataicola]
MSRLGPNQLTALQVSRHRDGSICDGGGLWLVASGGARLWEMRYTSPATGKRRQMSLGSYPGLSLAGARDRAVDLRRMIKEGTDPLVERAKEKAARKMEQGGTFAEVAQRYITEQAPAWKDRKAAATWAGSLANHVFPVFGDRPIKDVDTDDVLSALRPIWKDRTETAGRLRGRMERILDYARVMGWREGENPARWRGHLSALLPAPSKVAKVQHHKAIPWADIASVMAALSMSGGLAAKAVRFACLTAARSGEVRSCLWSEIDMTTRVWTIPAEKMKAGRLHRVPLSMPATDILDGLCQPTNGTGFVFPGYRPSRPLTDVALSKALHLAAGTKDVTVHGLRSTFRDWAAEATDYPNEVVEMALAHAVGNKVEAAYRRGDLFEKRRALMDEWAAYCCGLHRNRP